MSTTSSNASAGHLSRRAFVTGALGCGIVAGIAAGMSALTPAQAKAGSASADKAGSQAADAQGGQSYDVIVIGAGGAGMTAAMSAHDGGARVLLLEKMAVAGGNTVCAEGGMNACCTKVQEQEGIQDSVELFAKDTYEGGHELGNMDLITFMCENSNAALERLADRGMYLTKLSTSGGASVKRIHRPEDGSAVGTYLVSHMCEQCEQRGVAAVTQMRVDELVMDDGAVSGVRATDLRTGSSVTFSAPAVIVTAGGFGANHEMLAQYRPELLHAVTTNQPGATGDGIALAQAVGADTVDMDQIQVHPTVEQDTSTLLSEGIRGDGAVLVNTNGERFVNELLTRDKVSAAEWDQPGGGAFAVFDKSVYDSNKSVETKFVSKGLALVADTLEELGQLMGVPTDVFADTMNAYNDAIAQGADDPQGREKSRNPIVDAPFYAIKVAPGIHHTMGGLRINTNTEVLDADGDAIPGLFAAGEVTGGIHGGNRLGGNAICDINVFGHQAAMSALAYLGITPISRDDLVAMTQQDGKFNQHATQHGDTACTDCHRPNATPVLTCTQCHDEAEVPDGWLTWDEAQQQSE